MARTPRLSTQNVDDVGYGHSLLFIKRSSTVTSFLVNILVTAEFHFYTFDGNNGLALNKLDLELHRAFLKQATHCLPKT